MDRRLMFFERLMYAGGDCCLCFIVFAVRGPLEEPPFRAALDRLQALHPMLQVDVVLRDGVPFFVTQDPPRPIPLRIEERQGDDGWRATLDREMNIGFPSGTGPLLRLVWLRGEGRSDFLLVGHHCIADGLTGNMLVRQLLYLALRPDMKVAGDPGFERLEDALAPEILASPAIRARARRLSRVMRVALPLVNRLLPARTAPAPNRFYNCRIDPATTRALRDEARRRSVPLSGLVGAALARAFREAPVGRRRRKKIVCAVDARAALPGLGRHAMFSLADSVSIDAPEEADIWEEARVFADRLTKAVAGADTAVRLLAGEMSHGVSDALLGVVRRGGSSHDFVFAYMGTPFVAMLEEPFHVEGLLAGAASMPWHNATTASCLTIRGGLQVGLAGRPPLLTAERGERVTDSCARILREALG